MSVHAADARRLRACPSPERGGELAGIWVQEWGVSYHNRGASQRVVRRGEAALIGLGGPYGWRASGVASVMTVPTAELGLSSDALHRASDRLHRSPLYRLVSEHVIHLVALGEDVADGAAGAALGTAGLELMRALIATAGPDAEPRDDETLLVQLRAYVRDHLTDPGLDAAEVANALAVSPRQLYRVCRAADLSLEQWIIAQRLEGARAELAVASGRRRPIAAVALRWGFKDPSHFSRRFHQAYGLLPSTWRRRQAYHPELPFSPG